MDLPPFVIAVVIAVFVTLVFGFGYRMGSRDARRIATEQLNKAMAEMRRRHQLGEIIENGIQKRGRR